MSIRIKDIPEIDRPVERLLFKGAESLGSDELLAIILKTGTINHSAKEIASSILKEAGNIKKLKTMTLESLKKIPGIGDSKAASILALTEISFRMNCKMDTILSQKLTRSDLVFSYYKERLDGKKQEYFYAIYLDSAKTIVHEKLLFIGTLNHSIVHPREVFKEALLVSASSIICIHNHPSGNVMPSKEDFLLTKRLVDLGKNMGIPVNDHIIIGSDTYYSFYENNNI